MLPGTAVGGRLSARRKRETVLRLLRGEDLESVSRELGITAARASQWRDQFLAAGQASLKSRAPDARDEANRRRQAKIGELLMENELLYAKVDQLEAAGPLARRRFEAMKGAHSISTRRAYGVQRVCRVWHRARSSVYARRQATTSPCRRGPVGAAPDDVLGRPYWPHARGVAVSWRRVPESLGEASGRGNPHVPGAGAPVDAGARPPGPAPRGPRARPEGARRDHHHRGPRCVVGHGHDDHGDRE